MLTTAVDNFPGFPKGVQGPELMKKMRKQVERFGAEFIEKDVQGVNFNKTPFELFVGGLKYSAKSVIIASGASFKRLAVPGESELIGRGVSFCALCDAPLFKGKKVVVVGGGDSAAEEALILSKYAKEVHIIHRRDKLRAQAAIQKKIFANKKLKLLWNTEVERIVGEEKVEKIILRNNQTGKSQEFIVDGVFIAIGHQPKSDIFKNALETDEKGYIKRMTIDKPQMPNSYQMATSIPGVFVAGDVHDFHYRQAITAAGFGCMAAMEVIKWLDER